MTDEQYVDFREKFQSIVYYKGIIKSKRAYISTLYSFDRNGSHLKAIEKATTAWRELKEIFQEKLNGKSYEEWKEVSIKISSIRSRIRTGGKLGKINATENYQKLDITSFLTCKSNTEETSTQTI